MLYFEYLMAKLGFIRIPSGLIRLCMHQEAFFDRTLKGLDEEDRHLIQPFAENQKAITSVLRSGQMNVNLVQGNTNV